MKFSFPLLGIPNAFGKSQQDSFFDSTPRQIILPNQESSIRSIQICCGWNHAMILQSNGVLFSWGANHQYQAGTKNFSSKRITSPEKVILPEGIKPLSIAAGEAAGRKNTLMTSL